MRAALRAAAITASGPNEPRGIGVPLPAVGVPTFNDRDVASVWSDHVFNDHMLHRLRGTEKVPAQKPTNP